MTGSRRCNIYGCVNNIPYEKMPNVSYHELPSDPKMRELWAEILDPYLANKRSTSFFICSLHFDEKCFKLDVFNRKTKFLTRGAIPTIFSGINITSRREGSTELQDPLEIKSEKEDVTEALPTDVQLPEEPITSKHVFSSVKIVEGNVKKDICRVCFKSAFKNRHLSDKHPSRAISYREMLEYVCEDVNLDFYPDPVICLDCSSLLLIAYDFKKTYSNTEKILRVYKSQKTSVVKATKLLIVACGRKKKSELQINLDTENVQETPSEVPDEHDSLPVDVTRESVDSADKPTEDDDEIGATKEVNTLLQREKKLKLDWGDGPYLCDMCGRVFADKQVCRKHMKVHFFQKGIVENFFCTVCQSNYENVNPDVHMDTHRPKKHKCESCPRQFDRRNQLRLHVRSAHLKEFHHVCHICGQVVKQKMKRHLEQHESKTHCPVCQRAVRPYNLSAHMRAHPGSPAILRNRSESGVCYKCGKFENHLGRHLRLQHDTRDKNTRVKRKENTLKYGCTVCGVGFSTAERMMLHSKSKYHKISLMLVEVTKSENSEGIANDHSYATLESKIEELPPSEQEEVEM